MRKLYAFAKFLRKGINLGIKLTEGVPYNAGSPLYSANQLLVLAIRDRLLQAFIFRALRF
jgi:hypothetical protein